MLKNVLFAILALAVIFLIAAATREPAYTVTRSASVAAPRDVAYAQVADFHAWDRWSPWAKIDPAMKTEFRGTPAAVGSSYYWTGNDKVGEGRMTLTQAAPGSQIGIKLEFIRPFASTNTSEFTFAPDAAGTRVTWTLNGNKGGLVGKAFGMFMDFDKMVGSDFERGLANLKTVAEAEAKKAPAVAAPAPATPPVAVPAVAK
jgi:hypothetical protein